jgi:hypothetical protein
MAPRANSWPTTVREHLLNASSQSSRQAKGRLRDLVSVDGVSASYRQAIHPDHLLIFARFPPSLAVERWEVLSAPWLPIFKVLG